MKRVINLRAAACLLPLAAGACANVRVHKVDVQSRLQGTDRHVEGFRYYLNRPYLVVAKAVPVTTTYLPVSLAVANPKEKAADSDPLMGGSLILVSQVPDPATGAISVFDLSGTRVALPAKYLLVGATAADSGSPAAVAAIDSAKVLDKIRDLVLEKFRADAEVKKAFKHPTVVDSLDEVALKDVADQVREAAAAGGANVSALAKPATFETAKRDAAAKAVGKANELLRAKSGMATLSVAGLDATVLADGLKPGDFATAAQTLASRQTRAAFAAFAAARRAAGGTGTDADPADPAAPPPKNPPVVQAVFLPDFEEQYAIDNRNVLAKTKYNYKFSNGTNLQSIAGSYNATDVPVKIIETFGKLVEAAGNVAKTRINPGAAAAESTTFDRTTPPSADFYLRFQQVIEPGMYRIQKSWERVAAAADGGVTPDQACGMFSELGLPVVARTAVLSKAEHDQEAPAYGR